jgi:hypothetical protein
MPVDYGLTQALSPAPILQTFILVGAGFLLITWLATTRHYEVVWALAAFAILAYVAHR